MELDENSLLKKFNLILRDKGRGIPPIFSELKLKSDDVNKILK